MLGPMWEVLTLTNLGLYDGHPELLFWRYVDTDVKDDPSDGWYNLMNSITSILSFMATTRIQSPELNINYTRLLFYHGISYRYCELTM